MSNEFHFADYLPESYVDELLHPDKVQAPCEAVHLEADVKRGWFGKVTFPCGCIEEHGLIIKYCCYLGRLKPSLRLRINARCERYCVRFINAEYRKVKHSRYQNLLFKLISKIEWWTRR